MVINYNIENETDGRSTDGRATNLREDFICSYWKDITISLLTILSDHKKQTDLHIYRISTKTFQWNKGITSE